MNERVDRHKHPDDDDSTPKTGVEEREQSPLEQLGVGVHDFSS